jgi:membrane dipeptidase
MAQVTATEVHAEAIVIDAVCPLAQDARYLDWYRQGGVTLTVPSVGGVDPAAVTMRSIARWKRIIAADPTLTPVHSVADIEAAKAAGQMGILLHFQGTGPIEDDLDLIDLYKELGVGIIGLCYNVRNRVGDGADERTDSGLSRFGVALVRRFNETGVIVDCSHTGVRTSLEAVEVSRMPVVASHSNPRGLHPSARNVPDDLIKAIASTGGLVGTAGFPAFLGAETKPTLDRFIDAIAYVADLVGIDHTGLGMDYYLGQHEVASLESAQEQYDAAISAGIWLAETYPPPPHHYPEGISTPRDMPNLTSRMLERGFTTDDVNKVLGRNWMRVYRAVWDADSNRT